MATTYQNIVSTQHIASANTDEHIPHIIQLAQSAHLTPASTDTKRVLLLAIDIQNDFMEGIGSLPVVGSKQDVANLTQWMFTNMASLTHVMCSLDCHSIMQIFHANWWISPANTHPQPFTIITYQDVVAGTWLPVNGQLALVLEYLQNLESNGQKQLCIWPYHCLEGTAGAKLESQFTKMLYYHAAARQTVPELIYKGQNPYTEMYGIIKAEYDKSAYINQQVLDTIASYDHIYIAGQASSHCVLASTQQIVAHFGTQSDVNSRITILEDCMSPIDGFQAQTTAAFNQLKVQYGIHIKKSTDVIL